MVRMMKNLYYLFTFFQHYCGSNLKTDDKPRYFFFTGQNQFDKMETITADTTTIIVTFDNKSIDLIVPVLYKNA